MSHIDISLSINANSWKNKFNKTLNAHIVLISNKFPRLFSTDFNVREKKHFRGKTNFGNEKLIKSLKSRTMFAAWFDLGAEGLSVIRITVNLYSSCKGHETSECGFLPKFLIIEKSLHLRAVCTN